MTHTMTITETQAFDGSFRLELVENPRIWSWEDVQQWLNTKGLSEMVQVFESGSTSKEGTSGDELLGITL
eukprot:CAMPEP_0202719332 /NCGR_PEP_ID=MMETSP1385-20130828/130219_1 /ASSEMBLY_ACC=CAM_ASM_000861 /TAXON_ID=933848 /ORGANISM="Elphidium margaritaceum" /LENGTH=69 /DNA_ID=CAMNT_0049382473 /DNA_START=61 /DNA_END=267 /DNA_ORIENTATION=-